MTELDLYNVAQAVIAGMYGNGEERVTALTKAGYDAAQVQRIVNAILRDGYKPEGKTLTVEVDLGRYSELLLIFKNGGAQ